MACVVESICRVVPQHRLPDRVHDYDCVTHGIEGFGESPAVEIGLGGFTPLVRDERAPTTAHLPSSGTETPDRIGPAPIIRTGR